MRFVIGQSVSHAARFRVIDDALTSSRLQGGYSWLVFALCQTDFIAVDNDDGTVV